jgi:hypothetical protein
MLYDDELEDDDDEDSFSLSDDDDEEEDDFDEEEDDFDDDDEEEDDFDEEEDDFDDDDEEEDVEESGSGGYCTSCGAGSPFIESKMGRICKECNQPADMQKMAVGVCSSCESDFYNGDEYCGRCGSRLL